MVTIRFKQLITGWFALLRYGAGIINWKVDALKRINRMTRKTLTICGTFHPKSDIDQLYVKQKYGGQGLISLEMCVRSEENSLGLYVCGSNEMLHNGVKSQYYQTENLMEKIRLQEKYPK